MPNPKEVFDHHENYWSFITAPSDDDFEGQHFDRKEAGRIGENGLVNRTELSGLIEQLKECISAFANANRDGGLLVIGVSSSGEVKGTHHLNEEQVNRLMSPQEWLRNQAATAHLVEYTNSTGAPGHIILIYVPGAENGICETLEKFPKAWVRNGKQNIPLTEETRERIKRDKRIVNFERADCCHFHIEEVDQDVLREFRAAFLAESTQNYDDQQLLYEAGAIYRDGNTYRFNNAGFLFFAARPQRILTWAYIRLLRFEINVANQDKRGLPTLDRQFDGAIPQQIRKIRAFLHDSSFFKLYQKRAPEGGFIEEPEFPPIVVDEAIINAVAHRDYGNQHPVECFRYQDAFVVENPGRLLQRDRELPEEFSLADIILNSSPRNSKLIEWLKMMRGERGALFVRAIGEGTKRMRDEMAQIGLPAPVYHIDSTRTIVTLFNNVVEREARFRAMATIGTSTEYTNLFPLNFLTENGQLADSEIIGGRHKDFLAFLKDALQANGWYIDQFRYGRITAHRQGISLDLPKSVQFLIRFYPAYIFQLREYWGKSYLCIDYTLEVKNVMPLTSLLKHISPNELTQRTAIAQWNGWQRGKLLEVNGELARVHLFDFEKEELIPTNKVIPDLPIDLIKTLLHNAKISFDLSREMKRHSLALEPGSARSRAEKTLQTAQQIADSVFPVIMGELRTALLSAPEPLRHEGASDNLIVRGLPEPSVEFNRGKESPDIRNGITRFGAYADIPKEIELAPICTGEMRERMAALITRLKAGKYKYSGSERTFKTRFTYNSVVIVPSPEDVLEECRRLLNEHPDWVGNANLSRLFLIYAPEATYSKDDESAPYYQVKRYLLEQGIPCQMVDTSTLNDPDWKDLNLALNIVAKCGITPWVLPNSIPDADFFVGLSYTQNRWRGNTRLLGYATVFNQFGRWEFYLGNTNTFSYEERTRYFASLTRHTLERLTLSEAPSIHFHYSARFSREDRQTILRAAREVRPNGTYSFVSINSHHNLRLYDSRAETDGSVSRGSYVILNQRQILLSTTGYNPFRKALGTPKPLEITIWIEPPPGKPYLQPDLKSLAVQILSLTKLNWASTDSLCGEPITTKYAGSIAYLTDAFLRQSEAFRLHPVLERTPWFI